MIRLLCVLILCALPLAAVAQDERPEPPPPWEAAEPEAEDSVLSRTDAQLRLQRYQRVTAIGTPFYVVGLSMMGWTGYNLAVNQQLTPGQALLTFSGTLMAAGGAGAMAWGSHSAAMALYDDAPAPRQILAGRIAYGVLGVGTTGLLASYLLWGPTQAIVGLSGAGLILLSGVPAVIQMAQNSTASRARRPTLALLPRPGGAGLHVVGAFR